MNSDWTQGMTYYRDLSPSGKKIFNQRCLRLSRYLKFKGMEGLFVTDEMRLRIAASLAQLTFGFTQYHLPAFRKILLYPNSFYHSGWKKWMKGFAAGNGVIALSWSDFEAGYANGNDNYNLGLHELAHALHLNLKQGFDSDPVFEFFFLHWEDRSRQEFERISSSEGHFLRKYGGTNMHEFFAVCVEHFFESPHAFREALPDLYLRTALLLNQDPTNAGEDYRCKIAPHKEAQLKNLISLENAEYKEKGLNWSHYLIATGMFVSPPVLLINLHDTLILPNLVFLGAGCFMLLGLAQFPWFVRKGWYDYPIFFALYVLFGCGLNGTAVCALLNNHISTGTHTEVHKIRKIVPLDPEVDFIQVEDPRFDEFDRLMYLESRNSRPDSVRLFFDHGLLGFDNLRELSPVYRSDQRTSIR
ncbi:MAG: zinc-dependent peptidase [Flavobacteriales bacterium]|nr:zinc-dependent peptidase [Flavobacteriales bacterium]